MQSKFQFCERVLALQIDVVKEYLCCNWKLACYSFFVSENIFPFPFHDSDTGYSSDQQEIKLVCFSVLFCFVFSYLLSVSHKSFRPVIFAGAIFFIPVVSNERSILQSHILCSFLTLTLAGSSYLLHQFCSATSVPSLLICSVRLRKRKTEITGDYPESRTQFLNNVLLCEHY